MIELDITQPNSNGNRNGNTQQNKRTEKWLQWKTKIGRRYRHQSKLKPSFNAAQLDRDITNSDDMTQMMNKHLIVDKWVGGA